MKIFRNIRYQLAAQIRVAVYLRYAIGEILLIVIGILIALAGEQLERKPQIAR